MPGLPCRAATISTGREGRVTGEEERDERGREEGRFNFARDDKLRPSLFGMAWRVSPTSVRRTKSGDSERALLASPLGRIGTSLVNCESWQVCVQNAREYSAEEIIRPSAVARLQV